MAGSDLRRHGFEEVGQPQRERENPAGTSWKNAAGTGCKYLKPMGGKWPKSGRNRSWDNVPAWISETLKVNPLSRIARAARRVMLDEASRLVYHRGGFLHVLGEALPGV
jgi:hypothetical protein